MGTFLDSLSKSTVEAALRDSEVLLLVSTLVLLIGIWGEYRKGEKWKKYLITFQVMVLVGIGVELLADAGIFLFSASLQRLEGADIQALDRKARAADDKAAEALGMSVTAEEKSQSADSASKGALAKSAKAESSSLNALDLAKGAREEADSFEKDILAAKRDASEAKDLLSDARQLAVEAKRQAGEATSGVNQLKANRSIKNPDELSANLKKFDKTEFSFSGVFADEESIGLLRQINDALQQAGWQRVKGVHHFPALVLFGKDDDDVAEIVTTGILISVESPESLAKALFQTQDLTGFRFDANIDRFLVIRDASRMSDERTMRIQFIQEADCIRVKKNDTEVGCIRIELTDERSCGFYVDGVGKMESWQVRKYFLDGLFFGGS